jgi:predicted nucleic acid-binding protein
MALSDWLETELPSFFAGRILNVDAQTADRLGRLVAAAGRPLPAIDMAATAAQHGLSLVTRNARDFEGLGVEVINPWGE